MNDINFENSSQSNDESPRKNPGTPAVRELEQILQASLEATADGILVVDNNGRLILSNERFAEMWCIPEQLIQDKDDLRIREYVMNHLVDPEAYIEMTEQLYGREDSVTDEVRFKDGRTFERFSSPLIISGKIVGRVWSFRDTTTIRETQSRLERSEETYRDLVENANSIILRWDCSGVISFINDYGQQLLGYSAEDLVGKSIIGTIVPERESSGRDLVAMVEGITNRPDEFLYNENENTTKDGRSIWVSWSNKPIYDTGGRVVEILSIGNDITERKRLEQQLFQAQKMEAVGQLAGGIAHDFNNLLMVINGYCELLLDGPVVGDSVRRDIELIKNTSVRAAALTRQLLAFGRRQVVQPKVIDLNRLMQEMLDMVTKLVGPTVVLDLRAAPGPLNIFADPIQVEQVLLNLAANARDAMPEGGELVLETRQVDIDSAGKGELYMVKTGRYALCSVTDTGTGIPQEILEHIFEPFFTTKESGKGTGLGLSTVYGIVKQNDGYIFARSKPGGGSSFSVYFPLVVEEELIRGATARISGEKLLGNERILLVEAEAQLLRYTKTVLERYGYRVIAAESAADALALCKTLEGKVDLLMTSVGIAETEDGDLAEKIKEIQPDIHVLLISAASGAELPERYSAIRKPFTSEALARKIRSILDDTSA